MQGRVLPLSLLAGHLAFSGLVWAQTQPVKILLGNFQNAWQTSGSNRLSFLASSYDQLMNFYKVKKPWLDTKLACQDMWLLYPTAWPLQGIFSQKPINRTPR